MDLGLDMDINIVNIKRASVSTPKAGITLFISLKSISCTTQLVETSGLLPFSTN